MQNLHLIPTAGTAPFAQSSFITAAGLVPTIAMTRARTETFRYRDMDKRIIDFRVLDAHRWDCVSGPLIYSVTDSSGHVRYIGKHQSANALRCRWVRHGYIHHQQSARTRYLEHLDAGRGELTVSSATAAEIQRRLPSTRTASSGVSLVKALEALWIQRHWDNVGRWNCVREPVVAGFDDGLDC
jgi:hypothetical protein